MQWQIIMKRHLYTICTCRNGDAEKSRKAQTDMKTAQSAMGELEYCAAEIDSYFVNYFNH